MKQCRRTFLILWLDQRDYFFKESLKMGKVTPVSKSKASSKERLLRVTQQTERGRDELCTWFCLRRFRPFFFRILVSGEIRENSKFSSFSVFGFRYLQFDGPCTKKCGLEDYLSDLFYEEEHRSFVYS